MERFINNIQIIRKELNKLPFINSEINDINLEKTHLNSLLVSDDIRDVRVVFIYLLKLLSCSKKINITEFVNITTQKLFEFHDTNTIETFFPIFIEYYEYYLLQLQLSYSCVN